MAKLAKKIKLNKLITVDKQHIDKKTDYIPKENLERIIGVARAHALWLHMDVLKHTFGFTGKQLIEYHDRLQGVLTYAIDDASGGTVEDIIRVTVHGSRKEDAGNMGYPEYEQPVFDPNGKLYDHYADKYCSVERCLSEYKQMQRTFIEFDKCEVASMLVLKDYFGFAHIRLRRFVENLRESFRNATWKLYEAKIRYFEKLCKTDFGEFTAIKGGKGVFWY